MAGGIIDVNSNDCVNTNAAGALSIRTDNCSQHIIMMVANENAPKREDDQLRCRLPVLL